MTSEQPPELDVDEIVDRAVDAMRADYVIELRRLALFNKRMAERIAHHDDACATSMLFVDLRLRRVADRLAAELRGAPLPHDERDDEHD